MMLTDELLETLADEFVELELSKHGISLPQFLLNPARFREQAKDKHTQRTGAAVDERMFHLRHPRRRSH
ncbi:hypothetical protein [Gynuella sp.]|uniref:hypothetical protein n=1 Tax=Gynuella sp. TaxID=2969146 RepID=UPI003D0F0B89